MTVCIGAICNNGKRVIVAADRMMTYGSPMNLQAEGAVRKINELTDKCVLLFSGSVPDGEAVLTKSKAKIQATPHQDIRSISETVAGVYQELKKKRAEDTILRPFLGVDFAGFQQLVAQSPSSQVLQQFLGLVMQHNLQLDIMVAGIDQDGAHLFVVSHPGTLLPMDIVGANSIGSGALHASIRLSLSRQAKTLPLSETIYNVYEGKIAAEAAPGVGKVTDIAILSDTDGIKFVDSTVLEVLADIHKERPSLTPEDITKLETACGVQNGSHDA